MLSAGRAVRSFGSVSEHTRVELHESEVETIGVALDEWADVAQRERERLRIRSNAGFEPCVELFPMKSV